MAVSMELFAKHEETLKRAVAAISSREYWSAYPDSPRAYDDEAPQLGERAFRDRLGRLFELDQPASAISRGAERSPYGVDLGIGYPRATVGELVGAATTALGSWGRAAPAERLGVCLEILEQLQDGSFEMAHAVMQTTGQPFLMAFQMGGPHALDRGLEAAAFAYAEMTRLPAGRLRWEKPQGRRDPLQVDKEWKLRPCGIAVAIAGSTSPTWSTYPGVFASLATGNPVIVKPHPGTILPVAIFVETARRVLTDAGFDPNVVQLSVDTPEEPIAADLVMNQAVRIVDYTGGSVFGDWLEQNAKHSVIFTAKPGVNSVVIDSTSDLKGMVRNLATSLTMYSGQLCTTPQNIYIPTSGIDADGEPVSFRDLAAGLADAIGRSLADDPRAGDILGAIKSPDTVRRIEAAASSGEVLLASRRVIHPHFAEAEVRTPVIVKVDADARDVYMREAFGPVIFVIATADTDESLDLALRSAIDRGAINWLVYTVNEEVRDAAIEAAFDAGVAVSFNLTAGLDVNQPAAFSDFHATGANPAGTASVVDPGFVANRFRFVGVSELA